MYGIYLFAGLIVGLLMVAVWMMNREGDASGSNASRLLTIGGIVITWGAFFLLPWIHFQGPDLFERQRQEALQNPLIFAAAGVIPNLGYVLNADATLEGFQGKVDIERELIEQVQSTDHLTGFHIWLNMPYLDLLFHGALALLFIIPLIALFPALPKSIRPQKTTRRHISSVYGVLALITCLLLLSYIPLLDTFGIRDDFNVMMIALLAGAKAGAGIWWALLGLLLLIGSAWAEFESSEDFSLPGEDQWWDDQNELNGFHEEY